MKLLNRVALITGASKGIGRSIAIGMAREGADIIVNYNSDMQGAVETMESINEIGRKCIIIKADIGKINEITEMFLKIREFGRLDILVNNAAVVGWTNLFDMTEEKWDFVIDTNLKGTFFCSLEAAKIMKENNSGCIVNISSSCAQLGVRYLDAYTASKGGIHALTKQLAVELARYNIRVNTFAPGAINVDRNLKDDPDYRTKWGSVIPLGRTAEPEEMVGPAVFLASEDSSFMTGQLFYVDGGWSIKGILPEDNFEKAVGIIPR